MQDFRGNLHHSSFWPPEGVEFAGKRVAVIGTGASGVQMIQEMGASASTLTVFQRTPNLTLPMGRRDLIREEQLPIKSMYPRILAYRGKCFAGFDYEFYERNTFDDTPEEREAFYEGLWKKAGLALWIGGYKDYLSEQKANQASYDLWRKKQSARVKNPEKNAILFPEEPPHPFGVKRPCLEQNYYEVLDQDNVAIVNLNENTGGTAINRFTEKGIVTKDGKEHEFDIIALATGFDVVTDGMTNMDLKSVNGTYLQDEWKAGANTYLGTTIAGYPNMVRSIQSIPSDPISPFTH
jgi:cation diffusion facilitator CzcD-associated flavoprotein CzcO